MPWTENQIDAIESTGGSVLVSAAAGSGKTSVLSERVIRLITREDNPVPADRLLIVTFTKDAAAEMKQRINEKLNNLIEREPSEELLKQKQRFYNATVSTIDSFCSSLVREYFHQLGISSDFRVADESEHSLIRRRAMDDTFTQFYESKSPEFRELVRAFLYKNGDSRLRTCVSKLSTFLECVPFPQEWLNERVKDYEITDFTGSVWGKTILSGALDTVRYLIEITQEAIELARNDKDLSTRYLEPFEEGLERFRELESAVEASDWDGAGRLLFSAHMFDSLKTMPRNNGIRERTIFKAHKENIKKYFDNLRETFRLTKEELNSQCAMTKPLISELLSVVSVYEEKLRELKNKKNILYFSDVSHLAVNLLAEYSPDSPDYTKTPLSFEIASRFDAVIVDEYQDINDVQDLIFNCVSNGSNLFVVGDVKQSIYTFRQTRPKLFTGRRDRYHRYNRENPEYPATIILDKNFRSRSQVCDTVNYIFSHIMTYKTADMDYTEDEYLYVGADYPESDRCETEIALIDNNEVAKSILGIVDPPGKPSKKKYKLDEATGETSVSAETRYIANRIKSMIDSGFCVTEKGGITRPAQFRDFAILMRSPGGGGKFKQKDGERKGAAEIVRLLSMYGVPAYCEQSESFFDNREIKLLLNMLRVIDNPINDIPLLSVLMSPLYGFTPDDMASLRANKRKGSLYNALKSSESENPKAAAFLRELSRLRQYASSRTVDELLSKLYELTVITEITGALNGATAASNLRLMRVYAVSFEANGYKSLSDFIGYIDRLIARKESLPSAPILDASAANRVRVLSIHKSKGLEFPVCFLIDTAHGFNEEDFRGSILIDSESGVGVRFNKELLTVDTAARKAIILKKKHDMTADEMRLLYVALTRAKEKLIITSSVDYASHWLDRALIGTENGEVNPFLVSSASSMLEWVLYSAAVNPKIRAVMSGEEPVVAEAPDLSFKVIKSIDELSVDIADSAEAEKAEKTAEPNIDYAEILRRNLAFTYRNEALVNLPQKVSASQIAHSRSTEFDTVLAVPKFIENRDLSATERGTAHHEFLRYCDFSRARENVRSEIDRLVSKNLITQKQADCIDTEALAKILANPFFERVINSPAVYREKKFTVEVAPSLIDESYSEASDSAGCIMQGSVDLAFEEGGKLFVVDYKTDRVTDPQSLADRYSKQLRLYESAMKLTLKKEIGGLYIYSLHLNQLIDIE